MVTRAKICQKLFNIRLIPVIREFPKPYSSSEDSGITKRSHFLLTIAEDTRKTAKECPFAAQRPSRPQTDLSNKAYSPADAMRDAVWRKKTAAKLKSLLGCFSNSGTCPRSSLDGVRGPGLTLW